MDAKIDQKNQKCRKKGMPKTMPKFDAENNLKSATLGASLILQVDAGGKGAGRFWLI